MDGVLVEAEGIEPTAKTRDFRKKLLISQVESPKASPTRLLPMVVDADLQAVMEAWATLGEHIRAAIITIVNVSRG